MSLVSYKVPRSKPKTRFSPMKEPPLPASLDNTSFLPLENESLSPKENSMQLHVKKLCRGGRWYLYLAVPLRQGSRFNGLSHGSRVMRRLSCSSTMTRQAVRRRRTQQASYHLARSRPLALKSIKMHQMRYKQAMHKVLEKQSGTPFRIDLT